MDLEKKLIDRLNRIQRIGLIAGAAGAAVSLWVFLVSRETFSGSYLIAFLFWLGITVGCLPMIFVHHLTQGAWGYPVRRFLEITATMMPWMALAFLPIAFNMESLYLWARPEAVAHDALLQQKVLYLNLPGFYTRAVFYFAVWIAYAWLLNRWSLELNRTLDLRYRNRLQGISGVGLVIFGLTVTFSAIDWGMSLEPHWYSTIYGFLFMVGQNLAGFAFVIVICRYFNDGTPLKTNLTPDRLHDLGKLLFAFVMLWAYIQLSQFIIIWSGNLAEEVTWYTRRLTNGWQTIAVGLALLQFALPFFLLLSRALKRNIAALGCIAALVLLMRWVDLFWLVKPVFSNRLMLSVSDISCFAAIGGFWLALWARKLKTEDVSFNYDPLFDKPLEEDGHGH